MSFITGCTSSIDLVYVVDSSGSINERDGSNWDRVKEFIVDITDEFTIGADDVRVGIVRYSNQANVELYLRETTGRAVVESAIRGMGYLDGTTNTAEGIELARTDVFDTGDANQNGDRSNIKNVMIVITDGQANERMSDTAPQARQARDDGIEMIAIGITDQINLGELQSIASGNDRVLRVPDFQSFDRNFIRSIIDVSCPVTPSPTPRPTPPTGMTQTPGITARRTRSLNVLALTNCMVLIDCTAACIPACNT